MQSVNRITAFAQDFVINGVADKQTYNGSANLYVQGSSGYSYGCYVKWRTNACKCNEFDLQNGLFELFATRTNNLTLEITNRLIRFIVIASDRAIQKKD